MKKEVKFFILGSLANMVAIGVIAGIIFLGGLIIEKIDDARYSSSGDSSSKSNKVTIGDYEYRDDNLYIAEKAYREYQDITCSELSTLNLMGYGDSRYTFISSTGELYELNTYKKYSDTNSNCRKVSDTKLRGRYQHLFVGEDSTLYNLSYKENSSSGYLETESANYLDIRIFKKEINANDVVVAQQLKSKSQDNNTIYTYLVLKTDGILYSYDIEYIGISSSIKKIKEEVYFKQDGEKVKYFYIDGYSGQGGIITDKGVYVSVLSVPECKTFADVTCEYKFEKEEYFSKYVTDIAYVMNISGSDEGAIIGYYNKEGKYYSVVKSLKNK